MLPWAEKGGGREHGTGVSQPRPPAKVAEWQETFCVELPSPHNPSIEKVIGFAAYREEQYAPIRLLGSLRLRVGTLESIASVPRHGGNALSCSSTTASATRVLPSPQDMSGWLV